MILLRVFSIVFAFFGTLVFGLGLFLWLKLRLRKLNPFLHADNRNSPASDRKTIEGEYHVIKESSPEEK